MNVNSSTLVVKGRLRFGAQRWQVILTRRYRKLAWSRVFHSPEFGTHARYIPWGISKMNRITGYCTVFPEIPQETPQCLLFSFATMSLPYWRDVCSHSRAPNNHLPSNPRHRGNAHCSPPSAKNDAKFRQITPRRTDPLLMVISRWNLVTWDNWHRS